MKNCARVLPFALLLILGGAVSGCLAPAAPSAEVDGLPSWEAFRAGADQRPDGAFIIDGDLPVRDEEQLRRIYDSFFDVRLSGVRGAAASLTVNVEEGHDDVWSSAQAHDLSYCVSQSFSAEDRAIVQAAMAEAAADWEDAADVDFTEVESCSESFFDVVPAPAGVSYIASAFFPSWPASQRVIDIREDKLPDGAMSRYTVAGVMRHELGHVLGFRHEHVRPEASSSCNESSDWRGVTPYDSSSAMHYPQCNGSQTGDLVITGCDAIGASTLYGAGADMGRWGSCNCDGDCRWLSIFEDDFESGWQDFHGGTLASRSSNPTYANSGTYSIRLRAGGSLSKMISDPFDASPYSMLLVSFSAYIRSFESGESFVLQVDFGDGWETLRTYTEGVNISSEARYEDALIVSIPSTSGTSASRIRFRSDAGGLSDYVYIDDVSVGAY